MGATEFVGVIAIIKTKDDPVINSDRVRSSTVPFFYYLLLNIYKLMMKFCFLSGFCSSIVNLTNISYPELSKGCVTPHSDSVIVLISEHIDCGNPSCFNLCSKTAMIPNVFNDGPMSKGGNLNTF